MTIYLKYHDGAAWSSSESFNAVKFLSKPMTYRESGNTLNYNNFSHLLAYKQHYELVISSDELYQTAKFSFIKNFFIALSWKYSLDDWSTEHEVILQNSGNMPLELIEGNENLPEISLTLLDKSAQSGGY